MGDNAVVETAPGEVEHPRPRSAPPSPEGGDAQEMPDAALLPRGERADEIEAALRAVRYRLALSRLLHVTSFVVPWVLLAGTSVALGVVCHALMTRPVPAPEVHVAFVDENGGRRDAGVRETLTPDRFARVVRNTLIRQLFAREEYLWESVQSNYDEVRNTATPAERQRYEAEMNDRKAARNPMRLYGTGPEAARARVVDYVVQQDPDTPFAATYTFVLAVQTKGQAECRIRKIARATFVDAREQMPPDVQARYSPAGYAFASWVSDPDPGQVLPSHCLRFASMGEAALRPN